MKYLMAVNFGENNMRQSMKFVLCGLVSLAMVQTVQAAEQHHSMDMDMSGMGA